MTSNNKILTVSYGTFSCTLEGFDDAFGTMKAIAEYFRDLASEDRYFGAEPPQPDADMLARIAEREISRRVEARAQDGQIVLSATPDGKIAEPDRPRAEAAAPVAAAVAQQQAATVDTAEIASPPATATPEPTMPTPAPESIAAKLARIRAVVEKQHEIEEAVYTEDEEGDAFDSGGADDLAAALESDRTADFDDDAVARSMTDAMVEDIAEDEVSAEELTAETIAEQDAPVADEAAEDDMLAEVSEAVGDAHEPTSQPDVAPDEDADDALDALMASLDAADVAEETPAEPSEAADTMTWDDEDTTEASPAASQESEDTAEADHAPEPAFTLSADMAVSVVDQTLAEDDAGETVAGSNLFGDDEDGDFVEEESDPLEDTIAAAMLSDFDDEDEVEEPRARVVKVDRATLEAAIEAGDIEDVTAVYDMDDSDEDAEPVADSTLSPEEEAELQQELAAVEAETGDSDDIDDATAHDMVGEDDVERLMAEAEQQLDEPEGSSRRNAFAHLRAAVAARKADDKIADDDDAHEEDRYRSDLASVVRPRRPVPSGEGRSTRPGAGRPAPLKLVAEQRIDVPDAGSRGPIRPRRVSGVDAVRSAEDTGSFAEFAEEMGAHDLIDLLEAAASYMCLVEGRDQFSRPQLMTRVRQVETEGFSREDGLRSFGQLLRAGKIEKTEGGKFTITRDIGYRPDHRAAG